MLLCWKCYRKKARSVGFQNTIAAEGNVTNLKELIIQSYDPKIKNYFTLVVKQYQLI